MPSKRARVELTTKAQKDLKALRHDMEGVLRQLDRLAETPLAGHTLQGSLLGARSLEFSLRGGGAYRAIYIVMDDGTVCLVFIIGTHENIYVKAERRIKAAIKRGE